MRFPERLAEDGIHPEHAAAICLDFDMAVALHGRWADSRMEETVEVDAPSNKNRKPKMHVRKYRTLKQVLGIDDINADPDGFNEEELSEIKQTVDDLRRDPTKLAEFLAIPGQ